VRDFEAVIDAAGMERFAPFGASQGGSIAVEYAAWFSSMPASSVSSTLPCRPARKRNFAGRASFSRLD